MDEFVIVKFPETRDVIVDGNIMATTNDIFILETGTYTFTLSGAANFAPAPQTHAIEHTTVDEPFVVTFSQVCTRLLVISNLRVDEWETNANWNSIKSVLPVHSAGWL